MEKLSVTKSNALIESSYRLSLMEMRVVLYGISLINPLDDSFPESYAINVSRFSELFNLTKPYLYNELKEVIDRKFWNREFSFVSDDGRQRKTRWLTDVEYGEDKEGYIRIWYNPRLQKALQQLKGSFTSYFLENVANFKSVYSVRIYELTIMNLKKQNKKNCSFILCINDLKSRLDLGTKYKRFNQFKERVLEKATSEINLYSNINLNFDIIRKGKTPIEIKFIVSYKTGQEPKYQIHKTKQLEQLKSELKNVLEELKPFRRKSSFTREEDIARLKLEKRRSELKSQLEKLSKSA